MEEIIIWKDHEEKSITYRLIRCEGKITSLEFKYDEDTAWRKVWTKSEEVVLSEDFISYAGGSLMRLILNNEFKIEKVFKC